MQQISISKESAETCKCRNCFCVN